VVQASANSQYHLAMSSNKTAMIVAGDSAVVTVTALDVNGGGVLGQNIVFSLPQAMQNEGVIISGPSTVATDTFGNAVFTVTIPTANPTNNPQVDTASLLSTGITVNATLTDATGATTQQLTHINGVNATNPQPIGQITVGQSNKISTSTDDVYYIMPMSVNVVGIDGKPVSNQSVTMSIAQLEYFKGISTYVAPGPWAPVHSVTCTPSGTPFLPISFTGPTISSTPTTATYVTDSTGKFDFSLRYAKNYAGWLDIAMTATATVSGTSISSLPSFSPLPVLASEIIDPNVSPPNQFSPYNPLPNDPTYAVDIKKCP
jgi:hypothetical protein